MGKPVAPDDTRGHRRQYRSTDADRGAWCICGRLKGPLVPRDRPRMNGDPLIKHTIDGVARRGAGLLLDRAILELV